MDNLELQKYTSTGIELINESDFQSILLQIESNLGNTDSLIREGCLDLLWELIESNVLSGKKLLEIGNRLIDNISYKFDRKESDSIFLRTFSVLIISLIITQDELLFLNNRTSFLPYNEYISWYEKSIHYAKEENDFRGYISGKGWAHAISHTADLLRDLAFHRYSTKDDHLEMLNLIASQFHKYNNLYFINNEDNRLARIVIIMMYRGLLNISDYERWIHNLTLIFDEKHWTDIADNQEYSTVWLNIITFLRSLYFTLLFGMKNIKNIYIFEKKPKYNDELRDIILEALKTMDNGLNYSERP